MLLERLERLLPLLTGGHLDAPERQRTLRATIEWSYDLLSPEEQRVFRWAAVFAGGWTLEAAEEVCGADIDVLESLVDKSLVRMSEARFTMLETIGEYAAEQLNASADAEQARRRHADFFLAVAESTNLAADAEGPQLHAIAIAEQANLRAALDWYVAAGDVENAVRLAVGIENFWVTNNPEEGIQRIGALLDDAGSLPPELRARGFRAYAGSAAVIDHQERATAALERSLAEYRALGDERGIAIILHRFAVIAWMRGDNVTARSLSEESLEHFVRTGFKKGEAQVLSALANVEWADGNAERAFELLERSATLAGEIGFRWWQAGTFCRLAECELALGHVPEAGRWAREGLAVSHAIGDRLMMVFLVGVLARVAAETGRPHLAARLWSAVEAEGERSLPAVSMRELEPHRTQVLAQAGPELEGSRAAGRRLSLDDAVADALAER